MCVQVFQPLQAALLLVVSSPWEPDMHGLLEAVHKKYNSAAADPVPIGSRIPLPVQLAWSSNLYSDFQSQRQIGEISFPGRSFGAI
jgi:hypothetical protein